MSQFVKAFRELSYAYSFIAECVSVCQWWWGSQQQRRQEGFGAVGCAVARPVLWLGCVSCGQQVLWANECHVWLLLPTVSPSLVTAFCMCGPLHSPTRSIPCIAPVSHSHVVCHTHMSCVPHMCAG